MSSTGVKRTKADCLNALPDFDKKPDKTEIAIVGMACRFPGAKNYQEFWANLVEEINSIQEITPERWDIQQYYSPERDLPNKSISKWGGLVDRMQCFDAPFFNISPHEAMRMDPQQRLLLEETWHCVEDAGIALSELQKANTSVYVGVMATDYSQKLLVPHVETDGYSCLGNYEGILANRISYFFNFSGESYSIDAACASSLVAMHEAAKSIVSGESDYAIAAGVNIICHPWKYISFSKAFMLSPDGQCKTFDAEANGYVPGEGIGVVLLMPLNKAIAQGRRVYGVLKGSAVHHNGRNVSITAPRIETQQRVIAEAMQAAGVVSENISYVEAHGTGTSLGDPIEIDALRRAFNTEKKQYCAIGSVKTNIGHLEAAAGVAGVIKVLLMMQHKKIPASLNIQNVNPIIDFANSPFQVARNLTEWNLPDERQKRYAGVSSFGFGGVDSHVILEEFTYEKSAIPTENNFFQPFILSAKSENSLKELVRRWQQYVRSEEFFKEPFANVIGSLIHGRENLNYRFASILRNRDELLQLLKETQVEELHCKNTRDLLRNRTLVLDLNWQGKFSYRAFQNVVRQFPVLQSIEKSIVKKINLFSKKKDWLASVTQGRNPALESFLIHYILGKAFLKSGLKPRYIKGKGCGEIAAAVLSGMIKFKTLVQWMMGEKVSFTVHHPRIYFYDDLQSKMIPPYEISVQYCKRLRDISVDKMQQKSLFAHYRQMIDKQFTFKKFMEEWKNALTPYRISLEDVLECPENYGEREQIVLMIALCFAHTKLNKKWHLIDIVFSDNAQVNEIVDLLSDNVINPEEVAHLLLDPAGENIQSLAEKMSANVHKVNSRMNYSLLKEFTRTIQIMSDPSAWLTRIIQDQGDEKKSSTFASQEYYSVSLNPEDEVWTEENISEKLTGYLTRLWQDGVPVHLNAWYPKPVRFTALPAYPFIAKSYWIKESSNALTTALHPFIDRNISSLSQGLQFLKIFTGEEFYLTDHQINHQPVLPGVAYLEMARAAGELAGGKGVTHIKNITWIQPITFVEKEVQEVRIHLSEEAQQINFEVCSGQSDGAVVVHAQGKLSYNAAKDSSTFIDLKKFKDFNSCKNTDEIYERFHSIGFHYGDTFQVIKHWKKYENEAFAALRLPEKAQAHPFFLHPSLMDGILQSAVLFASEHSNTSALYLPFSIDEVVIHQALPNLCFAHIQLLPVHQQDIPSFDLTLLDEQGNKLLDIHRFVLRALRAEQPVKEEKKVEFVTQSTQEKLMTLTENNGKLQESVEQELLRLIAQVLNLKTEDIQIEEDLGEYGMDSISFTAFSTQVNQFYNLELTPALLFEHRSLKSFAEYLVCHHTAELQMKHSSADKVNRETRPSEPEKNNALQELVERELLRIIAQVLNLSIEDIHVEEDLGEYGMDSISFTAFSTQVNQFYKLELTPALLFEHRSLKSFADYLVSYHAAELQVIHSSTHSEQRNKQIPPDRKAVETEKPHSEIVSDESAQVSTDDIAIIGLSGVLPGARNVAQFWNNMMSGTDVITEIPESRWDYRKYAQDASQGKLKWGGFIEEIDAFDAAFFNISAREANLMDPQQRKFLQTVWETMESAGYTQEELSKTVTGLFVGVFSSDYAELLQTAHEHSAHSSTGNTHSILANRVSYCLNLHGPSVAVDTACSSSLVALHQAICAIRNNDCDIAFVGGVNAMLTPTYHLSFGQAGMLSDEGRCKTFDQSANGYVRAEGMGAILIKPLKKALEDGDPIYGVIKGMAVNHGGKVSSLTVPNPNAQAKVIRTAIERAKVPVQSINYIEAHGTGTSLGDPIEINGLKKAFNELAMAQNETLPNAYCGIGSVKTHIGHLESAAGIAGLIKVLLAMQHHQLPGLLHFNTLNPYIEVEESPFFIVEKNTAWKRLQDKNGKEIPRRAGLSSFGFGGVNAHVILEEAPARTFDTMKEHSACLITISAKTDEALKQKLRDLAAWLNDHPDAVLENISYTLNLGRDHFEKRCAFVVDSKEELKEKLLAINEQKDMTEVFFHKDKEAKNDNQGIYQELFKQIMRELGDGHSFSAKEYKEKLMALANFYALGYSIDFTRIYVGSDTLQKISLPTYPFANTRYWIAYPGKKDDRGKEDLVMTSTSTVQSTVSNGHEKSVPRITLKTLEIRHSPLFASAETDNANDASDHFSKESVQKSESLSENRSTAQVHQEENPAQIETADIQQVKNVLLPILADILLVDAQDIMLEQKFVDLGLDSILSVELVRKLNKELNVTLSASILYDYPTIDQLAAHLAQQKIQLGGKSEKMEATSDTPVHASTQPAAENPNHPFLFASAETDNLNDASHSLIQEDDQKPEFLPDSRSAHVNQDENYTEDTQTEMSDIQLKNLLRSLLADILLVDAQEIMLEQKFVDLGLDSILSVELIRKLNKELNATLSASILYDYATINELAGHLALQKIQYGGASEKKQAASDTPVHAIRMSAPDQNLSESEPVKAKVSPESSIPPSSLENTDSEKVNRINNPDVRSEQRDIAIIGYSARLPGAETLEEFWENLCAGKSAVSEVPSERWPLADFYDPDARQKNKSYSKWGGFLKNVDAFDPIFFNIPPAKAVHMDPQQRLFLEECWNTLERAGYAPDSLSNESCGVFVGIAFSDYEKKLKEAGLPTDAKSFVGNNNAILAARIAYFLNLKGPSISIDTACSSSLVAIHQACQSLWLQECDTALAGGVSIFTTPEIHIKASKSRMLSREGQCKTFDDSADGFVPGEGVGVVLLKPLKKALADKDTIYGVIKGSSINQDGATNGITAPSAQSQAALELGVYQRFGINPENITYIEAHGTGTKLGDPIEIEALTSSFQPFTDKKQFCAIGSIKTNIGHTLGAAGVASVIKVLMCMQHRTLVPTLNFTQANKLINFTQSPFYVNTDLKPWDTLPGKKRCAGISSFAFSGTNAHLVLEEPPEIHTGSDMLKPFYLCVLSARTEEELNAQLEQLLNWSDRAPNRENLSLADISFTLNTGRKHFSNRCAIIAASIEELQEILRQIHSGKHPNHYFTRQNVEQLSAYSSISQPLNPSDKESYEQILKNMALIYIQGQIPDWSLLYAGESPKKSILPTYPFSKKSYWPSQRSDASENIEDTQESPVRNVVQITLKQPK